MANFRRLVARFRSLLANGRVDQDLTREVNAHLTLLADDFQQRGMSPGEARLAASRALGGEEQAKQAHRNERSLLWLEQGMQDLHYGFRRLTRSPGFAIIAVFSLAFAIGANITIFCVAKELLYNPLDVAKPQQLRLLGWVGDDKVAVHTVIGDLEGTSAGLRRTSFSYPVYQELKKRTPDLLFAFKSISANAVIQGYAQEVAGVMVSGNYYSSLGVRPQIGRTIEEADDNANGVAAVAVISDSLWSKEFGRASTALGQTIKLNGTLFTIVGVNPPQFTGVDSIEDVPDVFVPLAMQPQVSPFSGRPSSSLNDPDLWWLNVMERRISGQTDSEQSAGLDVAMAGAVRHTMSLGTSETLPHLLLIDGSRGIHQMSPIEKPIIALFVLVSVVLLLACANVATLLLARATRRRREMGVRMSLGAGRGRLLRQLLAENLLLALLSGLGGITISYFARNIVPALLWQANTRPIHFDWTIVGYATLLILLTLFVFGLVPAWLTTRRTAANGLQDHLRMATRRLGIEGQAIVVFQIALSTLLVVAAGLFLRTVYALSTVDLGFQADHVLLFEINLPEERYSHEKEIQLRSQLEQAFAQLPGTQSVSFMSIPYISDSMLTTFFETEAEAAMPQRRRGERITDVGNNFFQTLGIPIISGRGFGSQDTATSRPVAVINMSLARQRFPHGSALGQRFRFGIPLKSQWVEVVGICDDTRYANLRDAPPPQFFVPYLQRSEEGGSTYALHASIEPAAIITSIRQVVKQFDPDLPLINIRTQHEQIAESMRTERVLAELSSGFGTLALGLASIGVFGLMAYSVAQRTNEIGIRMALGAQRGQVKRMILAESAILVSIGSSVGVGSVLMLSRFVSSILYRIHPYDPSVIGAVIGIFISIALLASWIPAHRAAGIQPTEALRHE